MVLTNFRLLNGKGDPVKEGLMMQIKNGVITELSNILPAVDEDETVDLHGMTLMPGLIDLHVHLGGAIDMSDPEMSGDWEIYDKKCKNLLDRGVTAVRSGGDFEDSILEYRRVRGNSIPHIFTCGRSFQAKYGHPVYTVWGGSESVAANAAYSVGDRAEISTEVHRQKLAGADHIKAFLCDFDVMTGRQVQKLCSEDIRAIAAAAHECSMKLMVHCETPQDAITALSCGADTVEHLISSGAAEEEPPEEVKELLLSTGAYFVPTLAIRRCISELTGVTDPKEQILFSVIRHYFDSGVNMALGTDSGIAGVPIGEATHLELELICQAGIPPIQALRMAGEKAAAVIGRDDLGVIEIGAAADLIVVDGRPDECISDIRKIAMVMLNGRFVK